MQDPASHLPASHEPASAPPRSALRRAGVAVAGSTTVLVGVALIPLPGPGTLVVLGGLAVLRKEFPLAGKAADAVTGAARRAVQRVRGKADRSAEGSGGAV